MWRQLEWWFWKQDYEPFYKYLGKAEKAGKAYRHGDSWTEELNMTKFEVRNAFSKIGVAWRSYKQMEGFGDNMFGEDQQIYCSITNKITKQTFYYRNDNLVSQVILDYNLDYCFNFG